MFATSSRYALLQGRKGAMGDTAEVWRRCTRSLRLTVAAAASAAVAVSAFVGDGRAQMADAGSPPARTRVAAVVEETPAHPDRAGDLDLRTLLAQGAPDAAIEIPMGDDIVQARFSLSTPRSVDEDVAREHGVELVVRMDQPTFGWRIVYFRVPRAQSVPAVLADLRVDLRVKSAQTSVVYRPAVPSGPATASDPSKGAPGPVAKVDSKDAQRRSRQQHLSFHQEARQPTTPYGKRAGRTDRPDAIALRWLSDDDEAFVAADGRMR